MCDSDLAIEAVQPTYIRRVVYGAVAALALVAAAALSISAGRAQTPPQAGGSGWNADIKSPQKAAGNKVKSQDKAAGKLDAHAPAAAAPPPATLPVVPGTLGSWATEEAS